MFMTEILLATIVAFTVAVVVVILIEYWTNELHAGFSLMNFTASDGLAYKSYHEQRLRESRAEYDEVPLPPPRPCTVQPRHR